MGEGPRRAGGWCVRRCSCRRLTVPGPPTSACALSERCGVPAVGHRPVFGRSHFRSCLLCACCAPPPLHPASNAWWRAPIAAPKLAHPAPAAADRRPARPPPPPHHGGGELADYRPAGAALQVRCPGLQPGSAGAPPAPQVSLRPLRRPDRLPSGHGSPRGRPGAPRRPPPATCRRPRAAAAAVAAAGAPCRPRLPGRPACRTTGSAAGA